MKIPDIFKALWCDFNLNPSRHSHFKVFPNRVLKNKNQAVRQGARRYDKRSIFKHM